MGSSSLRGIKQVGGNRIVRAATCATLRGVVRGGSRAQPRRLIRIAYVRLVKLLDHYNPESPCSPETRDYSRDVFTQSKKERFAANNGYARVFHSRTRSMLIGIYVIPRGTVRKRSGAIFSCLRTFNPLHLNVFALRSSFSRQVSKVCSTTCFSSYSLFPPSQRRVYYLSPCDSLHNRVQYSTIRNSTGKRRLYGISINIPFNRDDWNNVCNSRHIDISMVNSYRS